MQQLARKFDAEFSFDFGSVIGEVDPPRSTMLSLMREAMADSYGVASAMFDVQSRLFRPAYVERIARLDHVRAAADRGARRKQHEARDAERRGAEKPARRKILGDRWLEASRRRASVTCGVYLRPSGSKPDALHQPLLLGLHIEQGLRRRHRCDHGARLAAAERRQPVQMKFECVAFDAAKQRGDFVRDHIVDVADEAQRQVIILRIDPARARQSAAQHGREPVRCRRGFRRR